jgi:signal transduction histidine kinase
MTPLARLRLRLTLWYAGVLALIVVLLGGGLFFTVRHQISRQLDVSLHAATAALMQATRIREVERARATGPVADAVAELHIPDRALYLFDSGGNPIIPAHAADWIRDAARDAGGMGSADRDLAVPESHEVRLHAERFAGGTGARYVAAVVVDRLELEDQYASLIEAFAAAALAALLLVAVGGWLLARQSTAPIERSMDQMRRFMADAAHELRTPATILRTRAEVALSHPRNAGEDTVTLQAVAREAERVGGIVGDLLTLARADAGDRPVAHEPFYLDDVASDAVDAARTLAERKGVALDVGAFDEAGITGDPGLSRQLILILLDNAIKFTPTGGQVRLDVSATDGVRTVEVIDSGIGIPADALPHVFERFYRGADARGTAEGAGLGLAIAKWIADALGARISLASTPGQGTRARVEFPAL